MAGNLRDLFVKYITHVAQSEGTDFIDRLNEMFTDVRFTDDEVTQLQELQAASLELERNATHDEH